VTLAATDLACAAFRVQPTASRSSRKAVCDVESRLKDTRRYHFQRDPSAGAARQRTSYPGSHSLHSISRLAPAASFISSPPRNSILKSTSCAWAAQDPPPMLLYCGNSPLNPQLVRADNALVITLFLILPFHSHEADRQVRSHRSSEENHCARKGWSRSWHWSCKAQRYDPTFRFQLQKVCPRACSPRAIKATPGHRTRTYSSLLLR